MSQPEMMRPYFGNWISIDSPWSSSMKYTVTSPVTFDNGLVAKLT
jgi:hypothetical protein